MIRCLEVYDGCWYHVAHRIVTTETNRETLHSCSSFACMQRPMIVAIWSIYTLQIYHISPRGRIIYTLQFFPKALFTALYSRVQMNRSRRTHIFMKTAISKFDFENPCLVSWLGQMSRSYIESNIVGIHIPFVQCPSSNPILKYSYLKRLTLKTQGHHFVHRQTDGRTPGQAENSTPPLKRVHT